MRAPSPLLRSGSGRHSTNCWAREEGWQEPPVRWRRGILQAGTAVYSGWRSLFTSCRRILHHPEVGS
jgi:hypothetical protein